MGARADVWMPLYIGDYLGDTQRLTTEQHGAYLLLLFDYWRNGPPPNDDAVLAQIARLSRPAWRKMKDTILAFFDTDDGRLFHGRVEEELQKADENHGRRSDRARKAAEARWGNAPRNAASNAVSNAPSIQQALPNECPPPSPVKEKPKDKSLVKKPLPGDWEPEEFGAGTSCRSIVDGWSPLELERQLERFRAHHERDGNRYANWQAAWKTWVLNSATFAERDERRQPQRHGGDLVETILAEEAAKSGPERSVPTAREGNRNA